MFHFRILQEKNASCTSLPLLFEILLKYYFGLKEENQSFHG